MTQIILSEEQARIVSEARELVEILNPRGDVLARIEPPQLLEEIAEAKRRLASAQPRYSAQQVHARLQALEQAAANGMGKDQLWELFKRLQSEGKP
jgi:hypothetical protein